MSRLHRFFSNLGVKKGYVFYGMDGMDEVTLTTTTKVCEIDNGRFNTLFSIPKITVLNFVHPRILQVVTAKKMLKSQKKFSAVKLRTQSVISLFSMPHSDFAQAARQIQFRTA